MSWRFEGSGFRLLSIFLPLLLFLFSCAGGRGYRYENPLYGITPGKGDVLAGYSFSPELRERILALDPDHVTGDDVKNILSKAPAPRIINIHGGIYPVYLAMESFSRFLIGMGYPEEKIRNPWDGSYSVSCYESSEKIAGMVAWYYEHEGMRPMLIGHSQGGMQAVKVLHELAGHFDNELRPWNPLKEEYEERNFILDPLTGEKRPLTGLSVSYATAVGSGGLTRLMPNQWVMFGKLRSIPDTVEEFTGFFMGLDIIGGDLMGFSSVNKYHPNGRAVVRNVQLPTGYNHVTVPVTGHLIRSKEVRDWINAYQPVEEPRLDREFEADTDHILWAADVWHSIKKHWVLELQRLIRAREKMAR